VDNDAYNDDNKDDQETQDKETKKQALLIQKLTEQLQNRKKDRTPNNASNPLTANPCLG